MPSRRRVSVAPPAAGRRLQTLRRSQRRLAGDAPTGGPTHATGTRTAESGATGTAATPVGAGPDGVPPRSSGPRRLWRSLVAPGRGQIIAAVMAEPLLVGLFSPEIYDRITTMRTVMAQERTSEITDNYAQRIENAVSGFSSLGSEPMSRIASAF